MERMMRKRYVAVIQAGGKGTRMRRLTKDAIPKPMLSMNGKPMLQWQIEQISRYGILDFWIVIGHLGEKIRDYFGDGSRFGVRIQYLEEKEPLGSAGGLYGLKEELQERDFLLIFGDILFDIDWNRMIAFHEAKGARATLLAHPNAHPQDSDLVLLDGAGRVTGIDAKNQERNYWYDNCVNAGLFVLSPDVLQKLYRAKRADLEQDLLLPLMRQGQVFGYRTPEYVKDAGTVERFYAVCREQEAGVPDRKNLEHKQKCVFLDRDGTINRYCGLLHREEQFTLEEGAAEAIRRLNASDYLVIVVTNQPVVARGMCGIEDVKRIHRKMQVLLGNAGAYLDDIVFCPHHPDRGYPEENPAYKVACNCRKPSTGMIDAMVKKYHIDLASSYIVGDSTADIQTGKNAGLGTVLLGTGLRGEDGKYKARPDFLADNLLQAAEWILRQEKEG